MPKEPGFNPAVKPNVIAAMMISRGQAPFGQRVCLEFSGLDFEIGFADVFAEFVFEAWP